MRSLGEAQVEEVKYLRKEGWLLKPIAQRFNVCEATISNILKGKSKARNKKVYQRYRSTTTEVAYAEEDFSQKPDDVLFKHVKGYDFIG